MSCALAWSIKMSTRLTPACLQSLGLPADFAGVVWRQAEQTVSHWSGGSTRQLAIAPADSELALRNFRWRFSSASVEQDGAFSAFAGYQRLLMLRDSVGLQLVVDQHQLQLAAPSYLARFSGNAQTYGRLTAGPVTDLNLIFANDLQGGLGRVTRLHWPDCQLCWQAPAQPRLWLILANTALTVQQEHRMWQLLQGDLAVVAGRFSLLQPESPLHEVVSAEVSPAHSLAWLGWLSC